MNRWMALLPLAAIAAGMTAYFALFVMINGAMVMGLAPVVGVPMPLLSFGGTAAVSLLAGFGVVMAVQASARRRR